jgi:hypothetical protein
VLTRLPSKHAFKLSDEIRFTSYNFLIPLQWMIGHRAERGGRYSAIDVEGMGLLVSGHALIDDWVQINYCLANVDGHKGLRGKRPA